VGGDICEFVSDPRGAAVGCAAFLDFAVGASYMSRRINRFSGSPVALPLRGRKP
jgi:hypothetical protein